MDDIERLRTELRQHAASLRTWRAVSLVSILAIAGTWVAIIISAVVLLPALADSAVRARLAENDTIESMRRIREATQLAEQGATFVDLARQRAEASAQAIGESAGTERGNPEGGR